MCVLKTNLLTTSQVPFLVANKKALMSGLQADLLSGTLDKKKAKKWDKKVGMVRRAGLALNVELDADAPCNSFKVGMQITKQVKFNTENF